MSGIVADGSVQAPLRAGIVRKVWSAAETARILRACKAHGVTITHLANVAGALASVFQSPIYLDHLAVFCDFRPSALLHDHSPRPYVIAR